MENKTKITKKELDFVGDVQQALHDSKSLSTSILLGSVCALILFFIVWAYFAVIDEVTVGNGKVIPSSKIKRIQNLEGGILEKIYVAEGDIVKKGQPLAEIDDTQFNASLEERSAKRDALIARITRLKAEILQQKKIEWPKEIKSNKVLISIEKSLFEARMSNLASSLKSLDARIALLTQESKLYARLRKTGAVSQIELLQIESKLIELESERDEKKADFIQEANKELNESTKEFQAIEKGLVGNKDKVNRTLLRSPVHGTVKQIYTTTIGQVIKSGEDVMDVVPIDDSLLVEARIMPKDIGFIARDQAAIVKISAYDFSIYGGLDATVEKISADSLTDERGSAYYLALVRTNKNYLEYKGKKLIIIPGMTATVHILTGSKSILDYILKPILKTKQNALQER